MKKFKVRNIFSALFRILFTIGWIKCFIGCFRFLSCSLCLHSFPNEKQFQFWKKMACNFLHSLLGHGFVNYPINLSCSRIRKFGISQWHQHKWNIILLLGCTWDVVVEFPLDSISPWILGIAWRNWWHWKQEFGKFWTKKFGRTCLNGLRVERSLFIKDLLNLIQRGDSNFLLSKKFYLCIKKKKKKIN